MQITTSNTIETQKEIKEVKETINHIITKSMSNAKSLSYALHSASETLSKQLNITEINAKSQIMDYFIHSPLLSLSDFGE